MIQDLYVQCPACSHILLVSPDLVGKKVDCPDCARTFPVPEVKVGLNPRLQSSSDFDNLNENTPKSQKNGDLLCKELNYGLKSLIRRTKGQQRELDYLANSLSLWKKQLTMIQSLEIEPLVDLKADEESNAPELAVASDGEKWLRFSLWFSCAGGLVAVVILLKVLFF